MKMDNTIPIDTSEDDEIIIIDSHIFKEKWKELCDKPISGVHIEKIEDLKNKYHCFKSRSNHIKSSIKHSKYRNNGGGQGGENDKINNQQIYFDYPATRHMRTRIGALFTNTEGKTRKNFTAFMNKLSPQNKYEILPSFINSLTSENIHIYMDQIIKLFQIQPSYHDLYMEVLYEIIKLSPMKAKELLKENFREFMKEEKTRIPENIANNLKDLNTSSEQMDQLCEYVQWKKRTKALLKFYIHCLSNRLHGLPTYVEIDRLFKMIAELVCISWNYEAEVDIYLDIALHAVEAVYRYHPNVFPAFKDTMNIYLSWDNKKDTLKPSSKFKVMDIIEIIRKNN